MVAAKFFEDQPCDNGYFATVGGVSVQEINAMELTFLDLLEYRVSVTGSEYNVYAQVMEAKADYLEKPRQHYLKEVRSLLPHFFCTNPYLYIPTGNCTRHKRCMLRPCDEILRAGRHPICTTPCFHPRFLMTHPHYAT